MTEPGRSPHYYPHTGKPQNHVISWRVPTETWARMQPFFAAFDDRKMATAMRWLLEQPNVRETINEKIREGLVQ